MINKRSVSIFTWLLSSGFLCYEILLRIIPNIITTDLQQHLSINAGKLAFLSSSYIFAYGIGQIPAGVLISRWGISKTLPTAFLIASLSLIAFSMTDNYILACGLRFLMGLAGAYAFVGCLQIIYNYFPSKTFALLTGFSVAIAASAGMISNAALTWIVKFYGWQFMLGLVSGFGLLNTLLLGLFLYFSPHTEPGLGSSLMLELKTVVRNKSTWVIGVICSLIYLPYAMFNDLWGEPLFQVLNHLGLIHAGWLISSIWFGWIVGSPIIGALVSGGVSLKRMLLLAGCLELTMLIILIIPFNLSLWILLCACFLLGAGASGMTLCYLWAKQHNSAHASASAVAVVNTIVSVFVLFTLPVIGLSLQWLNQGQSHAAVTLLNFSASSYTLVFSGLCILTIIAILLIYRSED